MNVAIRQVPGLFNYTQPLRYREKFQLVHVKKSEETVFAYLAENEELNDKSPLTYRGKGRAKTDLPITSDFGNIDNPYKLIYARLEGLQYKNS